MSECTHDCSSCGENCAEREMKPEDFLVKLSKGSSVKKVIGVVSGKGGVGKSMVTSLLAAASMREGFKTAILDGDITGPSIPKAFGLSMNLVGNAEGLILPATTTCGILHFWRSFEARLHKFLLLHIRRCYVLHHLR